MTVLFFGGVTLAYAIQKVNLHRRVALFVLSFMGSSIRQIMAGLMLTSWFLSMWISNFACAAIMIPVAMATADEYAQSSYNSIEEDESSTALLITDEQQNFVSKKKADNLKKSFILCVLYSTTYGGLVTIVGSGVTVLLKGYVDEEYKNTNFHITFFNYFLAALPASALMLIFCWIWLQIRYGLFQWPTGSRQSLNENNEHVKRSLKRQYNELGSLQWNELIVTGVFFITVVLWITRDLGDSLGGWSVLFRYQYISNGTVVVLFAILTMILPNEKPFTKNWKYKPIIDWNDLSKNFPWGTLILLGAGLSIAHAAKVSKLMDVFHDAFQYFHNSRPVIILLAVLIISEILTQLTSNISIGSIMFPIITSMSYITHVHPAYLLIPCTLAVSQSFLLPMSSQPNAFAFSTGFLRSSDLITTGIVMSVVNTFIICVAATTWMVPIFHLDQPFYANSTFLNLTFSNST
ncbi:hypothetical protein I4U23_005580 [Adineta vaga]|nr:hypothetical protein I4U23_005580 [Adineta vaga]